MAYPEHIPSDQHHQYLYRDEADLYRKIKDFLIHFPFNQSVAARQNFVIGYDWSTLAAEYDRRVMNLVDA